MTPRIAAVQAKASTGEVGHNIAKAVDFIQRASPEKVYAIVFAKAFVTGYDDAAFTGPSPSSAELNWLDPVQQAVNETGLPVVLNTALDRGGSSTLTDTSPGPRSRSVPSPPPTPSPPLGATDDPPEQHHPRLPRR